MTMSWTNPPLYHRTINIDGIHVFYIEAGPEDAPVVSTPIHLFDGAHYLLETHAEECATIMREFIQRILDNEDTV